jgi:hypothetical protein
VHVAEDPSPNAAHLSLIFNVRVLCNLLFVLAWLVLGHLLQDVVNGEIEVQPVVLGLLLLSVVTNDGLLLMQREFP